MSETIPKTLADVPLWEGGLPTGYDLDYYSIVLPRRAGTSFYEDIRVPLSELVALVLDRAQPAVARIYPAITAYTGGGASALDSIATAGGAVADYTILKLPLHTEGNKEVILLPGIAAEDDDLGIYLPDDYNASTNAHHWKVIS